MSLLIVWTVPCDSWDLHFVTPLLSRVRGCGYGQRRLEQIWLPGLNDTRTCGTLQRADAHAE